MSRSTGDSLRQFPASQRRGQEQELSRFVEEAVRAHILGVTVEQAQAQNAHLSEDAIIDAVGEALAWARRA